MWSALAISAAGIVLAAPAAPIGEARVRELFEEHCTTCHDESDDFNMEVPLTDLVGHEGESTGDVLITPGDPDASYLFVKMRGGEAMEGDIMPPEEPLSESELSVVADWIRSLAPDEPAKAAATPDAPTTPEVSTAPPPVATRATSAQHAATSPDAASPQVFHTDGRQAFGGTHLIALPTTTSLGNRTFQFRIDHRFGRIGEDRSAAGLDGPAIISIGLAYGILDGWDVLLRRTNSRKGWELGTKLVPISEQGGFPLSAGVYTSGEYLHDFDGTVENRWAGSVVAFASRLWADRVATMLSVGYHLRTNHNPGVRLDLGDGPVLVADRRDTLAVGFGSTVFVDRRRRWGIDVEYFLPIPDGADPDYFYYRGGDADPEGSKIGAWGLGGSYRTGRHLFQVFFTNNREIHTNLAAPGGQSGNPFPEGGPDFVLGFNLARTFGL